MLRKELRITKKKEFDAVFSQGKSRQLPFLGVKLVENNLTLSRFGLIISNKVSKSAVVRNGLRRRLRAVLFSLLPELKIGYDVVILTRSGAEKFTSDEIKKQLKQLLKMISL